MWTANCAQPVSKHVPETTDPPGQRELLAPCDFVARTAGNVLGTGLSLLLVPNLGRCFCMAARLTPKDIL